MENPESHEIVKDQILENAEKIYRRELELLSDERLEVEYDACFDEASKQPGHGNMREYMIWRLADRLIVALYNHLDKSL